MPLTRWLSLCGLESSFEAYLHFEIHELAGWFGANNALLQQSLVLRTT